MSDRCFYCKGCGTILGIPKNGVNPYGLFHKCPPNPYGSKTSYTMGVVPKGTEKILGMIAFQKRKGEEKDDE